MVTNAILLCAIMMASCHGFNFNNGNNFMDALSSHCTSGNFRPNNGDHMPQATPAPYTITVVSPSGTMYSPGQEVTITIEGARNATGVRKFQGFFIQGDVTKASFSGDITCGADGHNVTYCGKPGAGNTNDLPKEKVVCKWTPPDFQMGTLQFVATIEENFSTFWTGVKSETNLSPDPSTMTYEQKALQMREKLLRQMQGLTGFAGQNQNPFAGIFGAQG
ncbi:putative defense protein [Physella acuta]|uniref:putative defense protein n=1 Tax=Physella acuta TaxID=109671 RepID=UPI0027DD5274|nr:putative defense protein [Physella acuta]